MFVCAGGNPPLLNPLLSCVISYWFILFLFLCLHRLTWSQKGRCTWSLICPDPPLRVRERTSARPFTHVHSKTWQWQGLHTPNLKGKMQDDKQMKCLSIIILLWKKVFKLFSKYIELYLLLACSQRDQFNTLSDFVIIAEVFGLSLANLPFLHVGWINTAFAFCYTAFGLCSSVIRWATSSLCWAWAWMYYLPLSFSDGWHS